MIQNIFIANRGEIASRIAYTARRLGRKTACYYEVGRHGQESLQRLVDCLVPIHPPFKPFYLDGDKIIEIALQCHCDSIHPGFGFLSESALFAQKVCRAGLIWIGPPIQALELFADKIEAKKFAVSQGIACLSSFVIPIHDCLDRCLEDVKIYAKQVGYPLALKGSRGGGGMYMQTFYEERQFPEIFGQILSKQQRDHHDGRLFIEPYLLEARHIEVQLLVDHKQNLSILGTRECSIQRRHQKIIEEAPALISQEQEEFLFSASERLIRAMDYYSVCTIEYLLDKQTGEFYFLESNPRLQVEHTVTEEVFDIDLVEWQIRIAQKESLESCLIGIQQSSRHSIQARLYAEDSFHHLKPVAGHCLGWFPSLAPSIRWEIGVSVGEILSLDFDSMFAKVIATAQNREQARQRLLDTLKHSFFGFSKTNQPLLCQILIEEGFIKNNLSTRFLTEKIEALSSSLWEEKTICLKKNRFLFKNIFSFLRKQCLFYRKKTQVLSHSQYLAFFKKPQEIGLPGGENRFLHQFNKILREDGVLQYGLVEHKSCRKTEIFPYSLYHSGEQGGGEAFIQYQGGIFSYHEVVEEGEQSVSQESDQLLNKIHVASIPGKIITLGCQVGDILKKGELILIIESMKMEFSIYADRDGQIKAFYIGLGEVVNADQPLFEWS